MHGSGVKGVGAGAESLPTLEAAAAAAMASDDGDKDVLLLVHQVPLQDVVVLDGFPALGAPAPLLPQWRPDKAALNGIRLGFNCSACKKAHHSAWVKHFLADDSADPDDGEAGREAGGSARREEGRRAARRSTGRGADGACRDAGGAGGRRQAALDGERGHRSSAGREATGAWQGGRRAALCWGLAGLRSTCKYVYSRPAVALHQEY